jgi:hypothetical protein
MSWARNRFELVDVRVEPVHRSAEFVACIVDNDSKPCGLFWLNHTVQAAFYHDMESNKDLK